MGLALLNMFMTNNSNDSDKSIQPEELTSQGDVIKLLFKVFPTILLIVGTIGNVFSILVLCRKSMRKRPLSKYLICLSLADLLVLYSGLLPLCIFYIRGIDIRVVSSFLCKVVNWTLYFSLDLSAWILVSATLERVISVWRPHKVKLICTMKVFMCNMLFLVIFLLVINCHYLAGYDLIKSEGSFHCNTTSEEFDHFHTKIFTWIDLFFFCLGPFLFQLIGNAVMIVGFLKASRTMALYDDSHIKSRLGRMVFKLSFKRHNRRRKRKLNISSMTIMLLLLNVIYFVCTLPICIYFLETALWNPKESSHRKLVFRICNLLVYLNNATNFIAHVLSGRGFRQEITNIFREDSSSHTTNIALSSSRMTSSRSQDLLSVSS